MRIAWRCHGRGSVLIHLSASFVGSSLPLSNSLDACLQQPFCHYCCLDIQRDFNTDEQLKPLRNPCVTGKNRNSNPENRNSTEHQMIFEGNVKRLRPWPEFTEVRPKPRISSWRSSGPVHVKYQSKQKLWLPVSPSQKSSKSHGCFHKKKGTCPEVVQKIDAV